MRLAQTADCHRRTTRAAWHTLLGIIGFVSFAAAQNQLPIAAGAPQPRMELAVEGGRVSVKLENCLLLPFLDELTSKIPVIITPAEGLGEERLSLEFTNVQLDQALRLLLARYDAFYQYGATSEGAAVLRAVWVYPAGRGQSLRPVGPETWASLKELEGLLADRDPGIREKAYQGLIARPDPRSRQLVLDAIRGRRETDDGLRQRLLQEALAQGMAVPPELLTDLVRADRSEQIRWMALDALVHRADARMAAEVALSDASPSVRERAKEILTELESESRRPKATQPGSPSPQQ